MEKIELGNGIYVTKSPTDGVFLHWPTEDGAAGMRFMSESSADSFVKALGARVPFMVEPTEEQIKEWAALSYKPSDFVILPAQAEAKDAWRTDVKNMPKDRVFMGYAASTGLRYIVSYNDDRELDPVGFYNVFVPHFPFDDDLLTHWQEAPAAPANDNDIQLIDYTKANITIHHQLPTGEVKSIKIKDKSK